VVESTFGWLGRYRRLSKDYEESTESGQAFIYAAMIHIISERLAKINLPLMRMRTNFKTIFMSGNSIDNSE
jgi:putative transposase